MNNQNQATDVTVSSGSRALVYGGDTEEKAKATEFKRSLAVIVGINEYHSGIPPLKTAVNDACRLARILEHDHQYEATLLVEEVTLEKLRVLLSETLPNQVSNDDRVLFYFAGHGIALDGDDGPVGYLVPEDAHREEEDSLLSMHELHQALTHLPCRHLLAILDCCFAGAFRWSSTRDLSQAPKVLHQERYERFIRDSAWQVITSTAYDQKALDVIVDRPLGARGEVQQHSPFALALFEALAGKGDVFPPAREDLPGGDGVITATELYLYLRDYVELSTEAKGHFQTPGFWPLNKHDRGEYIFLVPGYDLSLPPAPELSPENNPYRGLQPFEEEHKDLFFGRSEVVEKLAEVVVNQPLTVVLSASGTGKSSLVKAGLVPYLKDRESGQRFFGVAGVTDAWFILPSMRPGESPMRTLETLLRDHLPDAGAQFRPQPGDPNALPNLTSHWVRTHPRQNLVLIIDQSEELITLCRDNTERLRFIQWLWLTLRHHPDIFRLVLTLRADFEPQLVSLFKQVGELETVTFSRSEQVSPPKLASQTRLLDSDLVMSAQSATPLTPERLVWSRFIVPPMSQAELREAIEGPASVRVLYFEPSDLVDKLIDEVIQTPGALPLLSFTLSEMYIKYLERRSDNRALTREDYEALGGVIGSLHNRASKEYEILDGAHRETMKRILLRMVVIEGGELARRRVPRAELVYPDETENQRVEIVLKRLFSARLIVGGESDGEPYVEPAHDALVRAWDRLMIWTREAEEQILLQRWLTQAANDWTGATNPKHKERMLWHNNPRLPQLQQILVGERGARRGCSNLLPNISPLIGISIQSSWLNRPETEFVQQSILRQRKNRRRQFRTVLGVMIALAVVAIIALYQRNVAEKARNLAEGRRVEAEEARNLAEGRRVEAEKARTLAEQREAEAEVALGRQLAARAEFLQMQQPESLIESILLDVESLRRDSTFEGIRAMHRGLPQLRNPLQEIAHEEPVWALAFSQDGSQLVTWSGTLHDSGSTLNRRSDRSYFTGQTHVWDLTTTQQIASLKTEFSGKAGNYEADIFFNSTGEWLVTGASSREIATGRSLHQKSLDFGWPLAFSPDGKWLTTRLFAVVGEETIDQLSIWDMSNGEIIPAQLGAVRGEDVVALSSDRKLLATANNDWQNNKSELQVWDIASGQKLAEIGVDGQVRSLMLGPDGQWLAAGFNNGLVQIWEASSGKELTRLPHDGMIEAFVLSPNNQWLVTASEDGTARIWDVATWQEINRLVHPGPVKDVAFSPDGQRLATACADGIARIWDITPREEVVKVLRLGNMSRWSFSPDGEWLAIVDEDSSQGQIGWGHTLTDQAMEVKATQSFELPLVEDMTFSPDGRWLAAAGMDMGSYVRLWGSSWITALGGERFTDISKSDLAGQVMVWDATTGQVAAQFPHSQLVSSIFFDPTGNKLATGAFDAVWLWDLVTGQELARFEHKYATRAVAFSPDGNRLVTSGAEDVLTWWAVWNTTTGEQIAEFSHDGANGAAFSQDAELMAVANGEGQVKVLEVNTGRDIATFIQPSPVSTETSKTMAFSPDRQWLATLGQDNMVRVWQVAAGEYVTKPIASIVIEKKVMDIIFKPDDSRWLALRIKDEKAATADKSIEMRLVLWHPDDLMEEACARLDRNLTFQEWQRNFADRAYDKTCPRLPVHRSFITAAEDVARRGEITQAVTMFQRAIELEPSLAAEISPEKTAYTFGAQGALARGDHQASLGNFEGALGEFQLAATLNPSLSLDPETRARELTVEGLTELGMNRAKDGDLDGALSHFDRARQLNPNVNTTIGKVIKGYRDLTTGNTPQPIKDQALAGYRVAVLKAVETKDVAFVHKVCWEESINGYAEMVMPACEGAVSLVPDSGPIHDTRGIARALAGDNNGAIEDFTFFVNWAREYGLLEDDATEREQWITQLGSGHKLFLDQPFDVQAAEPTSQNLLKAGEQLAESGQTKGAIEAYRNAMILNPIPEVLESSIESYRKLLTHQLTPEIQEQIRAGLVIAVDRAIIYGDARFNNLICWQTGIDGYASIALPACERAVELALDNGNYRDSRGLVRALLGDYTGALADLEFAVESWKKDDNFEVYVPTREIWIAELKKGRNPIAGSTLKALWNREHQTSSPLPIDYMMFSPDGTMIALETGSGTVQLRREDGALVRQISSAMARVMHFAFAPTGNIVALATEDGFVETWAINGNRPSQVFGKLAYGPVNSVAFSPDGTKLVTGGGVAVRLWQASDGTLLMGQGAFVGTVLTVDFAPDGRTVAVGVMDGTIGLWDTTSDDFSSLQKLGVADSAVNRVVFSPDGRLLAAGLDDGTVQLWRVADGKLWHTMVGHTAGISSLAFQADGQILISGGYDGLVNLWQAADGKLVGSLEKNSGPVVDLALTPDESRLAVRICSESEYGCSKREVQFWQTNNWARLWTWEETTPNNATQEPAQDSVEPSTPTADSSQTPPPESTAAPVVNSNWPSLQGKLAFSLPQGTHYKVYVVKVEPTAPDQPYASIGDARQPALSHDGKWLLVNGTGGGFDALTRLTSEGHQAETVTCPELTAESGRPIWSPDDRFLAFDGLGLDTANPQIYAQPLGEVDCDLNDNRLFVAGGLATDPHGLYPLWGPDNQLYFRSCSTWSPQGAGACGIWSVQRDGSNPRQLTDNPNHIPTDLNSERLLFMQNNAGNWDIYSVNLKNGLLKNLTDQPSTDVWGTLSPDGRTIALLSDRNGHWAIWFINTDGSNPHEWLAIDSSWGEVDLNRIAEERMSWSN